MTLELLLTQSFLEIKCPSCGRHLDKFKNFGPLVISRKCKSCKNNILTQAIDNRIINNQIDTIENSRDILTPNRFSNPLRINTKNK